MLFIFLADAGITCGQGAWPSPEVEQMYRHAEEYVAAGNYKDAITTCKQAILLAPDKSVLYEELGKAFYLNGDFKEAQETLSPLVSRQDADTESYKLLAVSLAATYDYKKAGTTLRRGIEHFPNSGMMYCELGKLYTAERRKEAALDAWQKGISKDAAYAGNYYNAARAYLRSEDVLWGLLYGETYLNLAADTVHEQEMKQLLFAGYKKFFDGIAEKAKTTIGKNKTTEEADNFKDAVIQVYTNLTPVISDGVTTENLVMVRIRFLMDWFDKFGRQYPYPLFSYQDNLVRNGKFEIYNEWLFGGAESPVEYNAWNQFHEGDISRFLQWRVAHRLRPEAGQSYNEKK